MGLAIFLRKRQLVNKFRELLINSLDTGLGDEALICSGFFQEHLRGSSFHASREGNLDRILLRHNITLTTVGIYNRLWLTPYRNFRDNLRRVGVTVNARLSRRYHWHAKIYVLIQHGRPIFGIIGSSNMTRNAFGLTSPFNFEADVVMWLDEFPQLNYLMKKSISELNQFTGEVIIADYDPKKNFGLTIEYRLNQLLEEINNTEPMELE